MSTTAETQLSKKCIKAKPANYFAERIENSSGNGTADLVLSKDNIDTWIELKCCARPKNLDTPVNCSHIRLGQIAWHRRKRTAGCTTWCLVQVGTGAKARYYAFDSLHMAFLKEGKSELWYAQFAYAKGQSLTHVLDCIVSSNHFKARQ